jgi:hypothetical protein
MSVCLFLLMGENRVRGSAAVIMVTLTARYQWEAQLCFAECDGVAGNHPAAAA